MKCPYLDEHDDERDDVAALLHHFRCAYGMNSLKLLQIFATGLETHIGHDMPKGYINKESIYCEAYNTLKKCIAVLIMKEGDKSE